jgi:hypothetical protein
MPWLSPGIGSTVHNDRFDAWTGRCFRANSARDRNAHQPAKGWRPGNVCLVESLDTEVFLCGWHGVATEPIPAVDGEAILTVIPPGSGRHNRGTIAGPVGAVVFAGIGAYAGSAIGGAVGGFVEGWIASFW